MTQLAISNEGAGRRRVAAAATALAMLGLLGACDKTTTVTQTPSGTVTTTTAG